MSTAMFPATTQAELIEIINSAGLIETTIQIRNTIELTQTIQIPRDARIVIINDNNNRTALVRTDASHGTGRHFVVDGTLTLGITGNARANNIGLIREDGYNPALSRGGIGITINGTFTMRGGTIYGNTGDNGGAVEIMDNYPGGEFNLHGGVIEDNIALNRGGGVYLNNSTLNMFGGSILLNHAHADNGGGGIALSNHSTFNMHGSTACVITGNTSGGDDETCTITVEGLMNLAGSWTNPIGGRITVEPRGTLHVMSSRTLTNSGVVVNEGNVVNSGSITGNAISNVIQVGNRQVLSIVQDNFGDPVVGANMTLINVTRGTRTNSPDVTDASGHHTFVIPAGHNDVFHIVCVHSSIGSQVTDPIIVNNDDGRTIRIGNLEANSSTPRILMVWMSGMGTGVQDVVGMNMFVGAANAALRRPHENTVRVWHGFKPANGGLGDLRVFTPANENFLNLEPRVIAEADYVNNLAFITFAMSRPGAGVLAGTVWQGQGGFVPGRPGVAVTLIRRSNGTRIATQVTNSRGTFSFSGVAANNEHLLVFTQEGRLATVNTLTTPNTGGMIHDLNGIGAGAANQFILITPILIGTAAGNQFPDAHLRIMPGNTPLVPPTLTQPFWQRTSQTGLTGRVETEIPGHVDTSRDIPAYENQVAVLPLTIVAPAGGTVNGRVFAGTVAGGTLVNNANVSLVDMRTTSMTANRVRRTTTNAQGEFSFTGIPAQTYRLVITMAGREARITDSFSVSSTVGHIETVEGFATVANARARALMVPLVNVGANQNPAGSLVSLGGTPLSPPAATNDFWRIASLSGGGLGALAANVLGFHPNTATTIVEADYINDLAVVQLSMQSGSPAFTLSHTNIDFGTEAAGTTPNRPATITVRNTGQVPIQMAPLPARANWIFTAGANWGSVLLPQDTATFTLAPEGGGSANTTVTLAPTPISTTAGTSVNIQGTFRIATNIDSLGTLIPARSVTGIIRASGTGVGVHDVHVTLLNMSTGATVPVNTNIAGVFTAQATANGTFCLIVTSTRDSRNVQRSAPIDIGSNTRHIRNITDFSIGGTNTTITIARLVGTNVTQTPPTTNSHVQGNTLPNPTTFTNMTAPTTNFGFWSRLSPENIRPSQARVIGWTGFRDVTIDTPAPVNRVVVVNINLSTIGAGEISGTVRDGLGATVGNATVALVNIRTGERWNQTTNNTAGAEHGTYRFTGLPTGAAGNAQIYRVVTTMAGRNAQISNVVRVGQTMDVVNFVPGTNVRVLMVRATADANQNPPGASVTVAGTGLTPPVPTGTPPETTNLWNIFRISANTPLGGVGAVRVQVPRNVDILNSHYTTNPPGETIQGGNNFVLVT